MKVLLQALNTKFVALPHSDFYNHITGRMYIDEPPVSITFPYVTVSIISVVPDYYFDCSQP